MQKRIEFLRDSSNLDPDAQLKELLSFELKTQVCENTNDFTTAILLQRIGALYFLKSDYTNAIIYTDRSLHVFYSITTAIPEPAYIIQAYFNLSECFQSCRIWSKQFEMYDSCIAAGMRMNTSIDIVLWALFKKAKYLFGKGDYQRCVEYANMGMSLSKTDPANAGFYRKFLDWQINAMVFLRQFGKAEVELNEIQKKQSNSNDAYEKGLTYGLLGIVQQETSRYDEAIISFKNAYSLSLQANAPAVAHSHLNNIGYLYMVRLKDYKQAGKFFLRALKNLTLEDSIRVYSNLGSLCNYTGEFDKAFDFYNKGMQLSVPNGKEKDLLTSKWIDGSPENVIEYTIGLLADKIRTLVHKGITQNSKIALEESLELANLVDTLFDKINATHTELQSKLFWRETATSIYENAIISSRVLKKNELLFYFFEKSRNILLVNDLDERKSLHEQELANLTFYKKKLSELNYILNTTKQESEEYEAVKRSIFLLKNEQDKARLKTLSLNNSLSAGPGIPSLKNVQQYLNQFNAALIEQFAGDSILYSLMISADTIIVDETDKLTAGNLAEKYIKYIINPATINRNFDDFRNVSNRLYKIFLKNFHLDKKRIIMSPAGNILPLESLVYSFHGKETEYLINNYIISYTYSAAYLLRAQSAASMKTKDFVGFAPVSYPISFKLSTLENSNKSLALIMNSINGVEFSGKSATRRNFLNSFYQYKIAQLYTHAAGSSDRGEPVIYFSDSSLYLSDIIIENKPATKLIVLSACETGLGIEYKGEGVFSFNRGFAALGIPSSVTNLWTIDNESTYKITELFYKYVAAGLSLDEAMQKAKIDFIKTSSKEKRLPYYWAAAILVGNSDAITLQKNRNWPLYILTIGVPVLIIILLIAIRKRKRLIPIQDTAETAS